MMGPMGPKAVHNLTVPCGIARTPNSSRLGEAVFENAASCHHWNLDFSKVGFILRFFPPVSKIDLICLALDINLLLDSD